MKASIKMAFVIRFACLACLVVVLQAAKVHYVPETSTPPAKFIQAATAYNPVEGDIYHFSGVNQGNEVLSLFAAFNLKSKRWRHIEPSNAQRPGNTKTESRLTAAGVFDDSKQLFYVFGGEALKSLLNDLWKFDVATSRVRSTQWMEVQCSGEVPPQMKSFGSTSYRNQDGDLKLVVGYGTGANEDIPGLYE
jgi:hypothetical protein